MVKKAWMMACFLMIFCGAFCFCSIGFSQEVLEQESLLLQEDPQVAKEALSQAFLPYVATAKLDIKLCGKDQTCKDLAEEYINTYYLVKKQCLRVFESDRLLCQQFNGDCSKLTSDLQGICEVFVNVDIPKAKELGLDQEWQYLEDLIVDIALAQGYLENNVEACSNIIQKYIKKTQSQYYACDIVFAENPTQKVQEIIDFHEDLMAIEDEEAVEERLIQEGDEGFIFEEMPEIIEAQLEQEFMIKEDQE